MNLLERANWISKSRARKVCFLLKTLPNTSLFHTCNSSDSFDKARTRGALVSHLSVTSEKGRNRVGNGKKITEKKNEWKNLEVGKMKSVNVKKQMKRLSNNQNQLFQIIFTF